MKKNIIALWVTTVAMATSCTTVTNTSSVADVQPEVVQRPTVADLDVDPKRVEGHQEWKWSFFHRFTQPSLKLRKQNLVADMLRERDADVLVEPQETYTQKLFGKRTLYITGYPARLKNFHTATHEELRDLGLVATGSDGDHTACQPRPGDPVPAVAEVPDKRGTEPNRHIYLRGGFNFMKMRGDGIKDASARLGYDLTFGWRTGTDKTPFYYAFEVGLGSRGYKSSDDNSDVSAIGHGVRVSPFTFGYMPSLGSALKLDVHVGAYGSYDYTTKKKDKWDLTYSWDGHNDGFDVGLTAGVGVWYKRYNLDLSFQPGFLEKHDDAYCSSVMLRLGVAF